MQDADLDGILSAGVMYGCAEQQEGCRQGTEPESWCDFHVMSSSMSCGRGADAWLRRAWPTMPAINGQPARHSPCVREPPRKNNEVPEIGSSPLVYCTELPSSLSDLDWISARRSILPRIGS